uniref:Uncharacterized protein n=1 Tax=Rhipicephalus microplus TaxID=6941 RepID=A0A6M2D1G0_RHIMP
MSLPSPHSRSQASRLEACLCKPSYLLVQAITVMHIIRERAVTYIIFKKHRQADSTARGKTSLVLSCGFERQLHRTHVTPVPAPYFFCFPSLYIECAIQESVYTTPSKPS